ncbi:TIR domain-containing adapter molecule 1 [Trichomycterus rosablanca]|uniref:TIR domain-containing adapter molecule 1 n=1 Tax=Trichomycterus rosablanca TaxID=2290929 RepID=UPI002F3510F7
MEKEEAKLTDSFGKQTMGSSQGRPPQRDDSYPSSLRSTSTCTTYSLEISVSTADSGGKESPPMSLRTLPGTRDADPEQKDPASTLAHRSPPENIDTAETSSHRPPQPKDQHIEELNQCQDKLSNCRIEPSRRPRTKSCPEQTFVSNPSCSMKQEAQPISASGSFNRDQGQPSSTQEDWRAGQEEADFFFSFVILHALEDTEEAARLKKRLELISSTTGATFSEDFAEPGRSTFRCVEDAIGNSAYVMLLLTPNFNSRLNETSVDSALINSIEKPHKYNTVIPLLPHTNRLTRDEMPLVLKTKIPLKETKENSIFERSVRKLLSPSRIRDQKLMWSQEQRTKNIQERQRRVQEENRHLAETLREKAKLQELEWQRRHLQTEQERYPPPFTFQPDAYQAHPTQAQPFHPTPPQLLGPVPSNMNMWHPQPSCIHIQDAKYIMIGSNSTMTVGAGGDSGDEDCL